MNKITAKARVQIIVEVDGGAPWDDSCSIGQMYKQAAESGKQNLLSVLKLGGNSYQVVIVGEPKIIGIITEKS